MLPGSEKGSTSSSFFFDGYFKLKRTFRLMSTVFLGMHPERNLKGFQT
jgi:hypothetical protein